MSLGARVIREGGEVVIRLPIDSVVYVVVALEDCPCKATKSNATAETRRAIRTALRNMISRPVVKKEHEHG